MSNAPDAPPLYRTVPLAADADVAMEAVRAAAAGADPATLFWADRGDRAQCAVTLSPDGALGSAAQMLHVGMTALGDALGAVLPPLVIVSFRLPTTILLNDAVLGGLRICAPAGCGPEDVPKWLVLAIDIGVSRFAEGSDAAIDLSLTTFEDEGCMGITTGEVSGAFARYLLTWIDRWQKDGFEPVRTGWTAHARVQDKEIVLQVGGSNVAGRFLGLSDAGDVLLQTAEGKRAVAAVDLIEEVDGANA
jgi:BirA family transcriptional regulator, biotin operon repressor / biotin---[acetyl-CoA-carboxylase] ligase